jgi:hypothetical protein
MLPTENERDAWILYEFLMLARLCHGGEWKFPTAGDGDAECRRLGGALGQGSEMATMYIWVSDI